PGGTSRDLVVPRPGHDGFAGRPPAGPAGGPASADAAALAQGPTNQGPMKPVEVLLADDHAVLRAGLRLLVDAEPDLTVVAEAADGPEAIAKARRFPPDIVVLDLSMPRTDPTSTIRPLSRLGA